MPTTRPRRSPRRRACCARGGAWWSSISRRMRLEFLREQHAHRRLGFCRRRDRANGLPRRGSTLEPPRRLPGDPLTVVIWTARRTVRPAIPTSPTTNPRRTRGRLMPEWTSPAQDHPAPPPGELLPGELWSAVESRSSSSRPRRGGEARLWADGQAAGAAAAPLRLGDLRGRRQSARTHARRVDAHPRERGLAGGCAHLTCAGHAQRDRRRRPRVLAGGHSPHRGAARRSARWSAVRRPHGERLPVRGRSGRGAARDVADFEISVAAYPETHPEAPSAEPTSTI